MDATQTQKLTLDRLHDLCRETIKIKLKFGSDEFEVEARKLLPSEEASLIDIQDVVVPPMIRGKTPEDDRIDYSNPDFIRRKNEARRLARALGLYQCVPMFQEARPGLTDRQQILEFVQGKLSDKVLEMLWVSIQGPGAQLAGLVNFS